MGVLILFKAIRIIITIWTTLIVWHQFNSLMPKVRGAKAFVIAVVVIAAGVGSYFAYNFYQAYRSNFYNIAVTGFNFNFVYDNNVSPLIFHPLHLATYSTTLPG